MPRHKSVDDAALLEAVRRRVLDEISARNQAAVVNQIYGGGSGHSAHQPAQSAGVQEQMSALDPDLYDYMVRIEREDKPVNPETGKPTGWTKTVHRYREPKEGGGGKGQKKK